MDRQKKLDDKLLRSVYSSYTTLHDVIKLIDSGADPLARDSEGLTLLHHLFITRSGMDSLANEVLPLCIERGLDINARDNDGLTPLHYAAKHFHARNGQGLRLLVELYGADSNARSNNGTTPLHSAAGGYGAVKELLQLGADPMALDGKGGMTPLHYAALRGLSDAADELLTKGADPAARSASGQTPADFAAKNHYFSLAASLRKKAQDAEDTRWKPQRPEGPQDPWKLIDKTSISRMHDCSPAGYRVTEIFNFSSRLYTHIATNLETKAEALTVRTFDEFADKRPLKEALAQIDRLHGEADPEAIYPPRMDKQPRLQPRPQE